MSVAAKIADCGRMRSCIEMACLRTNMARKVEREQAAQSVSANQA